MKTNVPYASVFGALVFLAGGVTGFGQSNTALIAVEKASQAGGPWVQVPVTQIPMTGDGRIVDPSSSSAGFYRLQIQARDAAGEPVGLPLAAVPGTLSGYAQDHLDSLKTDEAEWYGAALGPVVVPLYHPAVNGGKQPAFYEFKVVGQGGRLLSPVDPRPERGYILVSSGPHSPPITEYATEGATPSEKLRFMAKSSVAHIVRYSASYWAAEDGNGQLLASLGSRPYCMPEGILDFIGKEPTTEILDNKVVTQPVKPVLNVKPYATYAEFKNDVVSGPVHTALRYFASERAAVDWNLRGDKPPEVIPVPLKQTVLVLNTQPIASADVEDPIAIVTPDSKSGLSVTGLEQGATLLMVITPEMKCQFYVLAVGAKRQSQSKGWSSWSSTYCGSCSDVPAYNQEYDLSGCCNDAWSGCGNTAWAMFYGYWDNRGVTGLIGGAEDTPWSNNDDVRACIRTLFGYTDTWCTGIEGNAATNPWDMDEGYQWAPARDEHIDISMSWTVPYTSSGPRNRAKASICDDGRPAIVGIGYYAHYPFAYGYRYRNYTVWGVTWKTERQWRVAMGWGGSSCSWVDANECWYGTRGRCF